MTRTTADCDAAFLRGVSDISELLFASTIEGVGKNFLVHQEKIRRLFSDYDSQKLRVREYFKTINSKEKNHDKKK